MRLRGWKELYTRRTMQWTGCSRSRSEATMSDEEFAEFASSQYMSGPSQRVLVPYRGRTYMATLVFTSQQVFVAQPDSQWAARRILDSNTHGKFWLLICCLVVVVRHWLVFWNNLCILWVNELRARIFADPAIWTSDGHISSACLADPATPVFDGGCTARTTKSCSWATCKSDWEQKAE